MVTRCKQIAARVLASPPDEGDGPEGNEGRARAACTSDGTGCDCGWPDQPCAVSASDPRSTQRKQPCLYPLPDGRRCCECETCHGEGPITTPSSSLFSACTWEAFDGNEKVLGLMRDADAGDENALELLRVLAAMNTQPEEPDAPAA